MQLALPKPVDMHIERDMIEKLVNAYFTEISADSACHHSGGFLSSPSPSPILLYSICLVAAARRDVPQSVFDSIRFAVSSVIKAEDVLSTASIANVQSLLILCMVGDCHSQYVPNACRPCGYEWVLLFACCRYALEITSAQFLHLPASAKIWASTVSKRSSKISSFAEDYGVLVSLAIDGK